MKIVSIEPTPSPHSMKVNLDEQLPDGQTENYKQKDDQTNTPDYVKQLLQINGVKELYRVIDFITVKRNPRVAWEEILPAIREVLGSEEDTDMAHLFTSNMPTDDQFGEVKVYIQMFRYLPAQVKLEDGNHEQRFGLPERFMNATIEASAASENMLMERRWVEQKPRYGDMETIGHEVTEEITASYDDERLQQLVQAALSNTDDQGPRQIKVTPDMLDQPNWKDRYAVLDHMMDPTVDDLPVLDKALDDEKGSVRRLAAAYLGMVEEPEVFPYLYKALKDKAVNVRRTAGDCLSDLGFTEAIPEMISTLSDSNRLVRWRGAMYLYEVGDETAIPALQNTLDDPEFEVRMQAKMALERIESGKKAEGSIWYQMQQATKD